MADMDLEMYAKQMGISELQLTKIVINFLIAKAVYSGRNQVMHLAGADGSKCHIRLLAPKETKEIKDGG